MSDIPDYPIGTVFSIPAVLADETPPMHELMKEFAEKLKNGELVLS